MLSTLLSEVQQLLEPVAKSVVGEHELSRNHAPPRYVFIRRSFKGTGVSSIGGNPRSLRDRAYELEVHCWGRNDDEADRLTLALETACRTVFGGRNYSLDEATAVGSEDGAKGVVWICTLVVLVTTPVVRLEAAAPDDERETTTATSVEVESPAGTPDDDEIEIGD